MARRSEGELEQLKRIAAIDCRAGVFVPLNCRRGGGDVGRKKRRSWWKEKEEQ